MFWMAATLTPLSDAARLSDQLLVLGLNLLRLLLQTLVLGYGVL